MVSCGIINVSKTFDVDAMDEGMTSIKTPVTVLQEYLLKRNQVASYNLIYNGVGTHEPLFKFEVMAGGQLALGTGKSKKEAKHEAARVVLQKLKNCGEDFTDFVEDTQSITSPYAEVLKDNAVGALADFCAQHCLPLARYDLTRDEGLPHAKVFSMQCSVSSLTEEATARTKKQAKQLAAQAMLETLRNCLGDLIAEPSGEINHHNKDGFDESCKTAYLKMNDTGVKMIGSGIPLGLNIAEYYTIFRKETFFQPEALEGIKSSSLNEIKFLDNPEDLLRKMFKDKDVTIENGVFDSVDKNVINIWLSVNTNPPWTFFGFGSTEKEAVMMASTEAIHFFVHMTTY